jgi:hypothetical protein
MPTADLAPLGSQQTSQHARTGEWVLQVQQIEAMHDRQLRLRHRPRQVIDTATTDVESFGLFADRQIVLAVNHRFALSNPALLSAPSKKSFSKPQPWPARACCLAAVILEHNGRGAISPFRYD